MMNGDYEHAHIDVNGVRAHYIEAGEGHPFVLVHGGGAGSCGETGYGDVLGALGRTFHAIAPDIVGYGRTKPRGPEDYWGQAQGDFLVQFLEALDLGPVFLAGHSYGGFTVSYAALERPDLVERLILIDSLGGTFPIRPTPEGRTYFLGPAGVAYEQPSLDNVRESMEQTFVNQDLVTDERVALRYEMVLRNYEYAKGRSEVVGATIEAANRHRSYKGRHIADWAAQLAMPVLLTWSSLHSHIHWGIYYLTRNPNAEMHIFPWSGHPVQSDQRDRWIDVVTDWLTSESVRRPG
jgi:pimeloyl-ACP methyl ester carboxylesterase